ncbi:unnamed protein product [Phytophthora fragariaefolia]|uniref:Unnamed protein product n=1 Tax=Phytophthora fragariaefolia TaxID=1490495 RepID=A0A9W6XB16_9STRA|nr:unnamed protein product [Phytophthora fragariaefolia]
MAAQASTETSVRQLTDQHRDIAVKLGEALTARRASLREQLQQLQKVQDERGQQIESYASDRLAKVLQDVQKETHDSQLAIASQTDEVRQNLTLMERNINSTLSGMMEHVQKLIEDKLVGCTVDVNTGQIVQQQMEKSTDDVAATLQVALATEGVASAIKRSVEQDLHKACGSIHDELLRCAQDVNGPLYELVRDFISETTARANRQLESRIQKLLTNTQSDINLQVQRQADVTTALREHVMKMCVRVNKRNQQTESASLESTIARLVKKEVGQCIKALQSKDPQSVEHAVRQDRRPAEQPIPSQNPIEHSLQSAVEVVCKTIKDGVRDLTSVDERQSHRTARSEPGGASDGEGISDSDGDSEFEKRMLETREKSYRHCSGLT